MKIDQAAQISTYKIVVNSRILHVKREFNSCCGAVVVGRHRASMEAELYFLVADFLARHSPCSEAATALQRQHGALNLINNSTSSASNNTSVICIRSETSQPWVLSSSSHTRCKHTSLLL